ncbi:MAG: hypothetical protein KDA80_16860 [Planctomycetaceae bacterium]|nr:hypothetical protein [Planctomycetaceae bacterium]
MLTRPKSEIFRILAIALLLLGIGSTGRAADLKETLDILAEDVVAYMNENAKTKLSVDTFNGPRTGTGRTLSTGLIERLKTQGDLQVVDSEVDAQLVLRGDFTLEVNGTSPFVLLEVRLLNAENGAEQKEFRSRITESFEKDFDLAAKETGSAKISQGPEKDPDGTPKAQVAITDDKAVTTLAGPTADTTEAIEKAVDPQKPLDQITESDRKLGLAARSKAISDSIKNPSFHQVSATIMSASEESKFHMQLNVSETFNRNLNAFPIVDKGGIAFAPFQEGQFYSVTIINQESFDIGVELLIDGVNSMAFSENAEFRDVGKWVIPAGRSGNILGYFINPGSVDAFQVSGKPIGPVEETLADQSKIGTITAAIYACWEEGDTPPRAAKIVGDPADLRTVRGPRISTNIQTVQRVFCETALAFMTVRYVNPDPPTDLP